ncbi:hypothetical protein CF326_g4468 [Tilletia indica]|nr:hypothetical protein CF326_g4468 [Tilletia indica]
MGALGVSMLSVSKFNLAAAKLGRKKFMLSWHPDKHKNSARANVGTKTFIAAWTETSGREGYEAWWENMEKRYLQNPSKYFLGQVGKFVERWTAWKQKIVQEDDMEKSVEQRAEEERVRQEGIKKLEERMAIERLLEEEKRKAENKARWAREKAEKKAAYEKSREPWNALSPAEQQRIIQHNRTVKNQKKTFRKRNAKSYKKDIPLHAFMVPKPTFNNPNK